MSTTTFSRAAARIPIALLLAAWLGAPAFAQNGPFGEPFPLKEITPGPTGSTFRTFTATEHADVFLANRGAENFSPVDVLWRTDGTPEGTYKIHPDDGLSFSSFAATPRLAYFTVRGLQPTSLSTLWRTDGTAAGTFPVTTTMLVGVDHGYLEGSDLLVFSASETGEWDDLDAWVTDGTPAGTHRLAHTFHGGPTYYLWMYPLADGISFIALDPMTYQRELWLTDGTAEGTRRVAGFGPSTADLIHHLGGALWVQGTDPEGYDLWRSDGTAGGTRQVRVFDPILQSETGGRGLVPVGDLGDERTLWMRKGPESWTLWVTDGTVPGTRELMPLALDEESGFPRPAFLYARPALHGVFYFVADDGTIGYQVWRTDGTTAGTRPLFEDCSGPCVEDLAFGTVADHLVFRRTTPETGTETWLSDGTAEGTRLLADACPGPCSSAWFPNDAWESGGQYLFAAHVEGNDKVQLWTSDLTAAGTKPFWTFPGLPAASVRSVYTGDRDSDHFLFLLDDGVHGEELWALPVHRSLDPSPPAGPWLASAAVPGFDFKVRITAGPSSIVGEQVTGCIPETLCVSGAVPGRAEVFLRVVGPKPNGHLWPTLVKFSTSTVEVWVRQGGTGETRYYRLEGARPGVDELPGLFDRGGFLPALTTGPGTGPSRAGAGIEASFGPSVVAAADEPPPTGPVFTSPAFPDFRFRARISAGDRAQEVRQEAACIDETLCLSGAVPGRAEVFLRVVGPKPNGRLWPTIVKFTTSAVEVWVEQVSTGTTKYYRIEGAAPGHDELTGLFDRGGFAP